MEKSDSDFVSAAEREARRRVLENHLSSILGGLRFTVAEIPTISAKLKAQPDFVVKMKDGGFFWSITPCKLDGRLIVIGLSTKHDLQLAGKREETLR